MSNSQKKTSSTSKKNLPTVNQKIDINQDHTQQNRLVRAIEKVSVHDHLCLIYKTHEEQFNAAIPFIRIGLEHGEKCIYIADDNTTDVVFAEMQKGGIDVDKEQKKGALSIIGKKEAYLKKGYFDPEEMITFLKTTTERAKKEGYSAMRATGEMTWIFGGDPGVERLIEYESKLNDFLQQNDCLALCQYNHQRFSEDLLIKVIYTHPLVIFGNVICKNFYYIPPNEFLGKNEPSIEHILNNLLEREKAEKKLNQKIRALRTISKCNNVLVHGTNETELLKAICKTIVKEGNYVMAWIGYKENDKNRNIKPVASAGFSDNYPELTDITWADTEKGHGPTGTSTRTGEISIAKNILSDPNFIPWRKNAIKRGYASSISIPLIIDTEIIGTVNIYASEADAFDKEEVELLSELASDLAYWIKALRISKEHVKALEELKQASEYNRSLIEASLDPLVTIGPDGKITDASKSAIKITGNSISELIGTDFSIYFTDPEKARAGYKKAFEEDAIRDYPLIIKSRDGNKIPVLYNASVYKDETGKTTGIFAALHDITELKKAESRIKDLNELRGKFLNIISHQMRTPMSAVNWNIEMLLNGDFGKLDELQKKFLETTHAASIKTTSRINDLLTAMDIEEGRIKISPEEIAIESIVGAVIHETHITCELKGLSLAYTQSNDELPPTYGDAEKLRSVIMKLMENAVAYTKDGGKITVTLSKKKTSVRFEVTDTGIGIPAHEQHRIFERFFRASNASIMQTDAFGLNLYISKYFINQHGGQIGFQSIEDKGSTFWFEIPIRKE